MILDTARSTCAITMLLVGSFPLMLRAETNCNSTSIARPLHRQEDGQLAKLRLCIGAEVSCKELDNGTWELILPKASSGKTVWAEVSFSIENENNLTIRIANRCQGSHWVQIEDVHIFSK